LVRKAQHIPHTTVSRSLLYLSELASAPDKAKSDIFMIGESVNQLLYLRLFAEVSIGSFEKPTPIIGTNLELPCKRLPMPH
jgi:hypothetical protein